MIHRDPFLAVFERIADALERAYPESDAETFAKLIRAERAAAAEQPAAEVETKPTTETATTTAPEAGRKKGTK